MTDDGYLRNEKTFAEGEFVWLKRGDKFISDARIIEKYKDSCKIDIHGELLVVEYSVLNKWSNVHQAKFQELYQKQKDGNKNRKMETTDDILINCVYSTPKYADSKSTVFKSVRVLGFFTEFNDIYVLFQNVLRDNPCINSELLNNFPLSKDHPKSFKRKATILPLGSSTKVYSSQKEIESKISCLDFSVGKLNIPSCFNRDYINNIRKI